MNDLSEALAAATGPHTDAAADISSSAGPSGIRSTLPVDLVGRAAGISCVSERDAVALTAAGARKMPWTVTDSMTSRASSASPESRSSTSNPASSNC